jgi:carboxyvinyl-carboxyphosphonate phosphorylmutase
MKERLNLKELLDDAEILVAPGAHDALTAKIIEKVGFDAVYMTGYGQSASHLGQADVGLLTMTEMVDRAAKFVEAVDIPVIADADTGFGNVINVQRTVREYEKAGVAALQLEDQVTPKKCGHMTGRQLISEENMVAKIKAAIDARRDDDLLIIARTDARTSFGIEEALKRGKAYEEAGADIIFIESPESKEEMKMINQKIEVPTLANMVEGGRTPLLPNDELEAIDYNLVIYPTASVYVTTKAMLDLMENLKSEETTANYIDEMIPFEDFNNIIGLGEVREKESKYF